MATRKQAAGKGPTKPAAAPKAGAVPAEVIREAVRGKRFLAADRTALDVAEIATWDRYLLRESRLLVPMDVQALYVPPGDAEPMVRLPMLVANVDGAPVSDPEAGLPDPFDPGLPRPPGVHLHWAMPDALLRGSLAERPDAGTNRLALPVLPDRFVVLRILLPRGGSEPVLTGWVIEADRAVAVPLAEWREGRAAAAAAPAGAPIARADLTGTVGGSLAWAGIYDAVLNRFAFHDPLADLGVGAPQGVHGDSAAYVVAGWWSDPAFDPLDAARSDASLHELLEGLRWRLMAEWGDANAERARQQQQDELRRSLGLDTATRWDIERPSKVAARAAPTGAPFVPVDKTLVVADTMKVASAFAADAGRRFVAPAWQLRSSLLHGSVYGVPVAGVVTVDRRPAPGDVSAALGHHDDDLLAAFASAAGASAEQRRATERLLAAFTAQKVSGLGSADGLVALEEAEHAGAFASLPSGSAGTDRFLQRVQTGGAGGLGIGRRRAADVVGLAMQSAALGRAAAAPAPSPGARGPALARDSAAFAADLVFATKAKPTLIEAGAAVIADLARSRVGEVLAPTEARVVTRPAPRWTFPSEPMVALRGAGRSLRHGNDGRGSADGKLTCRWPTHTITEISGVIAPDRFIRSLGNGSVPGEVLLLAREALLHDPYHDDWIAAALAPAGAARASVLTRLKAESALRFGADGIYDGSTAALGPKPPRAGRGSRAAAQPPGAGVREQQTRVADELRRFSLYRGADPDLVAVTAWAQPWVPLWLEWQVAVDGVDPATLAGWRLGAVDVEHTGAPIDGATVTLRGRALLTTGAARTLHDAIDDWLLKEEALDKPGAGGGLVDEATEQAYRDLDTAVRHLDLVTAALDGVRTQLLGLPVSDGLRRSTSDGSLVNPAPVAAPALLLAGALRLERARLVDAFGRTLELPAGALANAMVPTRATLAAHPGALAMPPRLLRPARWLFRLVDAATPVGAEGIEARVDQVDSTLQVNPVAGFLLPDHLDESLEVFGLDGAPLGELLHEAVSGGVVWEIAAGRSGPADAGPHHDLAPPQRALGDFAAALVAADSAARGGRALAGSSLKESALSALLRAIDTTLWTVDSMAALGSEHVAGLVGRPIAVVRAQLRLELMPPTDVDLGDPARAAEWAAAEQAAQRHAFAVRIGELTRSDDGVLGFFVDDDYTRLRLVDKAIAATATAAGRSRGQLGQHAKTSDIEVPDPIEHPYVFRADEADTLELHIGQTVTLTILMHPSGKATLSSGILPRKALALARDWVGKGLAAIAPSLRTGPVLVETDLDAERQLRLPKVSVFGKDQNFLWRDTPASWRTDAILAATQTALMPDEPPALREGWIRVAPPKPPEPGGST
ncbi:hypothetical protein [Piscinibacter koreensis]|uniref:Uncharacterized protein n=1 Tax=Piscinibacter koreensis TaxID=2742824 RepID=A0A7Y6NS73_9BURK|nr:hypothetical protein [Schlegelella koreensis]NUZ08355.1 hypothetical protein [Schlegelella koreensis]